MGLANYNLPDDKIRKVVRLSGAKSKKEAIVIALDGYLARKKSEELIASYGKFKLKWTKKSLRGYRGKIHG